jgi:HSP20 family protein
MPITDLIPWRKKEEKAVPIKHEGEQSTALIQQDFNRMFDEFFRGFGLAPFHSFGEQWDAFSPRVDVVEKDREIEVSMELPGMDENDIDVTLSRDTLTVSGEKKGEKEDRGRNYYRVERSYGSFRRSIPLPTGVDESKAEATFKKGVLTVSLPKTAETQGRKRIPIKSK